MKSRRWLRWLLSAAVVLVLLLAGGYFFLRWSWSTEDQDSGGPIRPLQAAYDVRRYDLAVAVDPAARTVRGSNVATVVALAPLDRFEIQLDDRMQISRVTVDGAPTKQTHADGLVSVLLAPAWAVGERHAVSIDYAGEPKVARHPPWVTGFVWEETPSGKPWIGVTGQGDGGDDWWPNKDHPSDEPDEGLSIALTVPSDLVGLSNGRKVGETANGDGTTTTRWEVSYPINNYLVTVNIAPYVPIEEKYHGIDGTRDETIVFWAIPEHVEKARALWKKAPKMLEVMGKRFGEYPFLRDKYWVAETSYLGMEHQTLVAYGSNFEDNAFGFDWLLLHETAHEWWGNKVTAADWADFWIHEAFATYAEALYVNDTLGVDKYLEAMAKKRRHIANRVPIVQGKDLTAGKAYVGDIYNKGAWVLHTLRYLLGDDAFFQAVWRFQNDERFAYRTVVTADFENLVAEIAGHRIDWFWDRYLRRAELPVYRVERLANDNATDTVTLSWDDSAFEMPLPVAVGGEIRRLELPGGKASFVVPTGTTVDVDPQGWVLADAAKQ